MAKKPIPKKNSSTNNVKGSIPLASLPSSVKAPEMPYAELEHVHGGNLLDPLDGKSGIKAKVFPPRGSTRCTFHWKLKDHPLPAFLPLAVPDGSDTVMVPSEWISKSISLTVLYWYEAMMNGVRHESLVGELFVQSLREDQTQNSLPEFPQEEIEFNTRWLNMHNFSGDALITFKSPPMAVVGMRLYLLIEGDEHLQESAFIWLEFGRSIAAEEARPSHDFKYRIPRSWLARRQDYSSITPRLAWIYSGNPGEFNTLDPANHKDLPSNGDDFHSRHTTLLRVVSTLDLPEPDLIESTLCSDGEHALNPTNSKNGGHVKAVYDGMTKGDIVCASVFGEGFAPVSLGCTTVQSEEPAALFDLPAWIIATFFKKSLKLIYSVQFGSHPPQTSPERVVKVLAPQLTKPCIEQATGRTLDLKTFKDDATVMVPIWDYAAVGQCVWVWITGTLEDGTTYQFYILMDEPFTADWLANGIDATIPRAELQKLADCSDFKLHGAVSFDGKCDLESAIVFPTQSFHIAQEHLVVPAPTVAQAVENNLTLWNADKGIDVKVDFLGNSSKYTIELEFQRPDGSDWPVPAQPGVKPGPVVIHLPRSAAIESAGRTVKVTYTVFNACSKVTSDELNLDISPPNPERLPTPEVPQETLGVLDLATFSGHADAVVFDEALSIAYWFALPGQECWLDAEGVGEDGARYVINVFSRKPITVPDMDSGVKGQLLRSELEKLKSGEYLELKFCVATYPGTSKANAFAFPVGRLQVIVPPKIRYENFTAEPTSLITAGQSINTPTMRINFLSGPGPAGIDSYFPTPGLLEGQAIVLCRGADQNPKQHLRLDLAFECKRVKFAYTWSHLHTVLTFYSASGVYLGVVNLNGANNGSPLHGWVDFSTPGSSKIGRIEIHSGDYMFFDFFTFWL
ncbi:hypothetical protein H0Z09_24865 [Pseudomonas sp. SWRI18]|uniref:hypothetical protein n=1 Tax=Pseudomonas sp. SWRI18 TaxID=2753888 RepID=UPI001644789A|nr:hypothetical protein [Pseudomonas sp. SWRI18]MBC3304372.1 hypothetical protein [Pseudomonas sp. SWRI18]